MKKIVLVLVLVLSGCTSTTEKKNDETKKDALKKNSSLTWVKSNMSDTGLSCNEYVLENNSEIKEIEIVTYEFKNGEKIKLGSIYIHDNEILVKNDFKYCDSLDQLETQFLVGLNNTTRKTNYLNDFYKKGKGTLTTYYNDKLAEIEVNKEYWLGASIYTDSKEGKSDIDTSTLNDFEMNIKNGVLYTFRTK